MLFDTTQLQRQVDKIKTTLTKELGQIKQVISHQENQIKSEVDRVVESARISD